MPKVIKRKKYPSYRFKKRRFKRRRRSSTSTMKIRGVSCLPDTMLVRLKYTDNITMTNVAGYGTYVFSINDCYDPNVTGVGSQPLGFDQWMNFYEAFQVNASLIYIRTLGNTQETTICCYPSINSTPSGSMDLARSQPYARTIFTGNQIASSFLKLKSYMSVKKLEGRNIDSINFTGTSSSSPTLRRYWIVEQESRSGSDISVNEIYIMIIYYVKFFRRKTLASS